MTPTVRSWWRVLTLVVLSVVMVGCAGQQAERDALFSQNKELADRLRECRAALDAAETDRARMASEVSRLQSELEAARAAAAAAAVAPTPGPAAGANTAFSGIEGVESFASAGKITVRVPGDVLFAPGKVDLRPQALRTLDQVAAVIKQQYPGNTIRVEGYTDIDPIRKSKWTDNLELSLHRAAAVHRHLQKQGISRERMYAAGYGEAHPRDTKAKSRRVEIVVETQ
jgi:outer membrane protein OmpA-like peptidoglycan-associated protein